MNQRVLERVLILAVLLGIAVQYVGILINEPEHGAVLQAAMAKGFLKYGALIMEYGPIFEEDSLTSAPSQHFPPLYPLMIAANSLHSSFDLDFLKTVSFRLVLATTVLMFLMTSWLFGRIAALFVTSSFLLHPVFLDNSAKCLGEYLQIILLCSFLLCIILSVKNYRMFIYAGLFLGLAYLSKSTIPFWFTVLVVTITAISLAIRMNQPRKYIITGLIMFLVTVFPWGIRNYLNHGTFETSPYIAFALNLEISQIPILLKSIAANLAVMTFVIIVPLVIFFPFLKKLRRNDPIDLFLITISALTFIMAVLYAAFFMVMENSFQPFNSVRYAMISFIPLLWLISRHTNFDRPQTGNRALIMITIFFISAFVWLYMAYTIDDKLLVNEADIALAQFIIDEGIFDEMDSCYIQLSNDINKNDFYYYLFALENKYQSNQNIRISYLEELYDKKFNDHSIHIKNSILIFTKDHYYFDLLYDESVAFNRAGKITETYNDIYRIIWLR